MNRAMIAVLVVGLALAVAVSVLAERFHVRALLGLSTSGLCVVQPATDVTPGTWKSGASMPVIRSELTSIAQGDQVYVVGGITRDGGSDSLEIYDPATDSWQTGASLPNPMHHNGIASDSERLYVSGGYTSLDYHVVLDGLWAYDPAADSWTQIATLPEPRAAHTMDYIDGKLYIVGGVGQDPTQVWAYDLATDTWDTSLAPLPTEREHLTSVVVDGKLYVIGGRINVDGGQRNLSANEMYDPQTDTWTHLTDMPTPRGGLAASVIDGRIHVAGGEISNPACAFNRHEVYDPQTDTWAVGPDLPVARHGMASASLGDSWYLIGGSTGAGGHTLATLNDQVFIFTPNA